MCGSERTYPVDLAIDADSDFPVSFYIPGLTIFVLTFHDSPFASVARSL